MATLITHDVKMVFHIIIFLLLDLMQQKCVSEIFCKSNTRPFHRSKVVDFLGRISQLLYDEVCLLHGFQDRLPESQTIDVLYRYVVGCVNVFRFPCFNETSTVHDE